ncbi:MAG: M28 family peptidase [Nitrospirae bacterium]|nr:M28 family peptidase [Nitrospirota bacterium]
MVQTPGLSEAEKERVTAGETTEHPLLRAGNHFAVLLLCLGAVSLLSPACPARAEQERNLIHHELEARIMPREHLIAVRDKITVPDGFPRDFGFSLHAGLRPSSETRGVTLRREGARADGIAESYKVALPLGMKSFVIRYRGVIDHPLEPYGKEQARGFSLSPGIISEEGVYLAASSYWYPEIGEELLAFSLKVELPAGWDAVSQGGRTVHERGKQGTVVKWESPDPQDGICLAAARFTEYTRSSNRTPAMAFLRTPDKELAGKYLEATGRYLSMYDKLIGPYPYPKFALVENFRETGFGLPSFTLLGPSIIRFPFIISSSYPHEILHNWWGNSVFPDYRTGNWSEGLTAYLADHMLREQQGSAEEYRLTTLQKYADYVSGSRDFPLTAFRSRHSSSSEAIGYGKSLMFFHMLRLELGDSVFIRGLRDFYERNKFRTASFSDLRKSFERVSGRYLAREFHQGVERSGAPRVNLRSPRAVKKDNGYILSAQLEQVQSGEAYLLRVPIAVTMEGREKAYQTVVTMDKKSLDLLLYLPSRPLRIDVDPEFDLFRRLDPREMPPAVSSALGAKKMLVVLPSRAGKAMLGAYQDFAKALRGSGPDEVDVKTDRELDALPLDRAVVVLGWENFFANDAAAALEVYGVSMDGVKVRIGKTELSKEGRSVVLIAGNPRNTRATLAFIASDRTGALPGLARKLPHYNKYSYLGFEGEEPVNLLKGRWPVTGSPLTAFIAGEEGISKVGMGELKRREALIALPVAFSEESMIGTIRFLAGDTLRGSGTGTEELDQTAEFIAGKFREAGLVPGGDTEGSYFETWDERPGPDRKVRFRNVIGVIPGGVPELADRYVLVRARYDRGGHDIRRGNSGKISNDADDNASGVAVLLELARVMNRMHPDAGIIFVIFTGEEDGGKGSRYYVGHEERYPIEKCLAMVDLDTIGRLGEKRLLATGAASSREWPRILREAGLIAGVDIDLAPENFTAGDQAGFEAAAVPAVRLSTGSHPGYHSLSETPDTMDAGGLVKVASAAREVIEYLSALNEPLTHEDALSEAPQQADERSAELAELGIIPDSGFTGEGCRVSGVMPDSPAETSGLREGDVIVRIGSAAVKSLKDLSDALKGLSPGSPVAITFLRDGEEMAAGTEPKEE